MAQDSESRHLEKFMVRMPEGMREELAIGAEISGRSMNNEMIFLLRLAMSMVDYYETEDKLLRTEHRIQYIKEDSIKREAAIKSGELKIDKNILDVTLRYEADVLKRSEEAKIDLLRFLEKRKKILEAKKQSSKD